MRDRESLNVFIFSIYKSRRSRVLLEDTIRDRGNSAALLSRRFPDGRNGWGLERAVYKQRASQYYCTK